MNRTATPITPDDVVSVHELTRRLQETLEAKFDRVAVAGEIADLTISGAGHVYFTLKDEASQIRATMWRPVATRLKFKLEDGMEVICRGGVQIYPPRGTYQINVTQLEPVGIGAQQLAFQQLFQKLKAEGLFNLEYKKPLPKFPRRIGIVTSPTGAAIHDIFQVIHRRWRDVELLVFPTQVQGESAPPQIVAAIGNADRVRPALDVLIVARGGGSQDDIACFNDERVVRSIFRCIVPVISAVGHEVDVTLCDWVADVRALTPSNAGELVVPDGEEISRQIDQWSARLRVALKRRADWAGQRLAALERHPAFRRPLDRLALARQHCQTCGERISRGLVTTLRRHQSKTAELAARLQSVSPVQVLARGYSVTLNESLQAITSWQQVSPGDLIETQLSEGRLQSRVEKRWKSG